jgi:hypothetical protein
VVAASVVTMALAVHGADTPLRDTASPASDALTPATQARNHAVSAKH